MPDGQFDWGGRLLKRVTGVQRFPQRGQKSRNRWRELNWETFLQVEQIRKWDLVIRLVMNGNAIAQRTKVTLGMAPGLSPKSSHRQRRFGTSMSAHHPGAEVRSRLGCSPDKAVRELGSERRGTFGHLSVASAGYLRRSA